MNIDRIIQKFDDLSKVLTTLVEYASKLDEREKYLDKKERQIVLRKQQNLNIKNKTNKRLNQIDLREKRIKDELSLLANHIKELEEKQDIIDKKELELEEREEKLNNAKK